MDFNPPSSGEIAWSNANDNQARIRALEQRVAQLEMLVKQLSLNLAATNNNLAFLGPR